MSNSENLTQLKDLIEFYSNISEIENKSENSNILNFLMDIISDSIWQWDITNDKVKCSRNLEKNAGKVGSTIDSFLKIVHPDDIDLMKEKMTRFIVNNSGENIFTNQNIFEHKYRILGLNGDWIEVMDKAKIISWTDDGIPSLIIGINLNI